MNLAQADQKSIQYCLLEINEAFWTLLIFQYRNAARQILSQISLDQLYMKQDQPVSYHNMWIHTSSTPTFYIILPRQVVFFS